MGNLGQTQGHLITGRINAPSFHKVECEDCGSRLKVSSEDSFCAFCSSLLPETEKQPKVAVEASAVENTAHLKCESCNSEIVTDYPKSKGNDLVMAAFCPVCGSEEVVSMDEGEGVDEEDTEMDEDEDFEEEGGEEAPEDVEAKVKTAAMEDPPPNTITDPAAEVTEKENTEFAEGCDTSTAPAVVDETSASECEPLALESAVEVFVGGKEDPNAQWYLFSNGEPVVRFKKTSVPDALKTLFASPNFMMIFRNRAASTTLAATLKEFNAEIIRPDKVMPSLEIEAVAYEKLQASVLPKFMDCLSMAILGMTRNVFPDLNTELKAAFFDELSARGVQDPQAVVETAFDVAGPKVFEALVAKAMEFFNKKDELREEIKATILSTDKARTLAKPVTQEDIEKQELKAKLMAGSIPLINMERIVDTSGSNRQVMQASVDDVRSRLSFGKKQ
jgi:Zn finger protein HypA/HybF involved in hydrogenase expression